MVIMDPCAARKKNLPTHNLSYRVTSTPSAIRNQPDLFAISERKFVVNPL